MKTDERILKYVSGIMSENELEKFETELAGSSELQNQLNKVKTNLNLFTNVKSEDLDDRYFAALVPKVRQKLEQPRKNKLLFHSKYAVPLLFSILAVFFITKTNKMDNQINFDNLFADIDSVVIDDDYVIDEITANSILYKDNNIDNTEIDELYNNEINNIASEIDFEVVFNNPVSGDYDLIENIPQEDFNEIYQEVLNKKFF